MSSEHFSFDVSVDNFEQYVLNNSSQVPVLVDFWAPWCGPCKTLMPMLVKLATEYNGLFLLAKVNIDEQQELAMQYGVRSVPTVKLIRHGQAVDEFSGALPESQVRAFIDRHIERESDRQLPEIMERFNRGEHETALQQLQRLREGEPDNIKLLRLELELMIEAGQLAEADTLLQSLPDEHRQDSALQGIASMLALKRAASEAPEPDELKRRLTANPDDSEARHQLAIQLISGGDIDGALEAYLELLRRDRQYGDEAARKGLLMIFDQLGAEDERVARYRRKMFAILH